VKQVIGGIGRQAQLGKDGQHRVLAGGLPGQGDDLPGVRRRVGHGNPGYRHRDPGEAVPVQRAEAARCPAGVSSGVHGHPGEDRRGGRLVRALIAGLQVLADGIL